MSRRYARYFRADGIVVDRRCKLVWLHARGNGAAAGSVLVYDGTSTGGALKYEGALSTTGGLQYDPPDPIEFADGIYVDVTNSYVNIIWEAYDDQEYDLQYTVD